MFSVLTKEKFAPDLMLFTLFWWNSNIFVEPFDNRQNMEISVCRFHKVAERLSRHHYIIVFHARWPSISCRFWRFRYNCVDLIKIYRTILTLQKSKHKKKILRNDAITIRLQHWPLIFCCVLWLEIQFFDKKIDIVWGTSL